MSIFVPMSQAGGQATAWRHATFPSAHGTLHPCYSCGASDSGGFPPCGGMLWVYCRHCSQVKAHLFVRLSLCLLNRKGGGLWRRQQEATSQHLCWLSTWVHLGCCIWLFLSRRCLTILSLVSQDIGLTLVGIILPSAPYRLYHRGCDRVCSSELCLQAIEVLNP